MKKLFFLLAVILLIAGCNVTPEKKVQKLIKTSMPTLVAEDSYKAGAFGTLDSVFSDIKYVPKWEENNEMLTAAKESLKQAEEQIVNYKKKDEAYNILTGQIENAKKIIQETETWIANTKANFKSEFIGFKMKHDYTIKDDKGNEVPQSKVFYVSPDMTKVYKDINDLCKK